jgi:hypothetical protein
MSDDTRQDELETLLERLCVDQLDVEECAALESLIAGDSDAQRRYVEVIYFREGLRYLLGHEEGVSQAFPGAAGTSVETPASAPGALVQAVGRKPSARSRGSQLATLRRRLPSWSTAASISFLTGALFSLLAIRGVVQLTASREDAAARNVLPVVSTPSSMLQDQQLGKITGLSLEASAEGLLQSMQVGQALRCGEVVQLPVGFMRVQLDGGPELLVEGPAEFSLIGKESIFVRTGRVASKGGQRLLLQTPLLAVECLDARASFEVTDDDSMSIHVSEGVATVVTTPHAQVESEQVQVLHSGEGMVAEPTNEKDVLRSSARGPLEHVVNDWSEIERRLSKYQRLVLEDRPVAYWPLYRVRKNHRVLDLTQNGHDGLPIGKWRGSLEPEQTDDSGRGVYFNGECYIEPDRKPPVKVESGFAIEGWAKPEGPPQYQAIYTSRWVLASHTPNQQCFGMTLYAGDTDRWEFWNGRGRHGDFWNVMESPELIKRDQWTHVVGTFTPTSGGAAGYQRGVGRLYVNGELSLEMEQDTPLTDFDWPARIGAAEYVPRYLTSWLFKGYLADIAVYGYPLEAAPIKEHYKVGHASGDTAASNSQSWAPWSFASIEKR